MFRASVVAGLIAALSSAAACVRGGFGLDGLDRDGAQDGAGTGDLWSGADGWPTVTEGGVQPAEGGAGDAQRPGCTWIGNWTFDQPTAVAELNSSFWESEPFLTPDNLTIYFSTQKVGGDGDVYVATRADRTAPFGPAKALEGLNVPETDTRFSVSTDSLTAYLATERPGGKGASDIWIGTRASVDQPWTSSMFSPLAVLNSALHEWDPVPTADGKRLYFMVADMSSPTAMADIYVAERSLLTGGFSAPRVLLELDEAYEDNPTLSTDERTIVFSRSRPGETADLWYAGRSSRDVPFASPQPVPAINTAQYHEHEAFLTADGCELYLTSNRPGGKGTMDIYRARFRPTP